MPCSSTALFLHWCYEEISLLLSKIEMATYVVLPTIGYRLSAIGYRLSAYHSQLDFYSNVWKLKCFKKRNLDISCLKVICSLDSGLGYLLFTLFLRWEGLLSTVRKTSLQFLDAFSHLYKRVCPSVRPSIRRSVCPSVHHTRVETMQKNRFWPKLRAVRARTHLMPCIRPC